MKKLVSFLGNLDRTKKISILVFCDLLSVCFSINFTFLITLKHFNFYSYEYFGHILSINLFMSVFLFWQFSLYRSVTRYMYINSMLKVIFCLSIYVCLYTLSLLVLWYDNEILTFELFWPNPIILWLVLFFFIGGSRQFIRLLYTNLYQTESSTKFNIIVYGTDKNALSFLSSNQNQSNFKIIGILTDDTKLNNTYINNIKVLGDYDYIDKIKNEFTNIIILFISSNFEITRKNFLVNYFLERDITVKNFLPINEFLEGKIIDNFFEIGIEDLLGRTKVETNKEIVKDKIFNKTIFITGAGGSIGSELTIQIVSMLPKKLIILDNCEFNLFTIEKKIKEFIYINSLNTHLVTLLGSVTNNALLEKIMKENKIDQVYHAAAYKHVPLVEHNIIQGIFNNVIGTYNIVSASYKYDVKNFVFISTDKAVRPTNMMGASKRLGELIVQGISKKSKIQNKSCIFSIVRFGNVLGSSGSVVPTFKEQIRSGGPVTVTHKEVKRYFMTIQEAVELVIQTTSMKFNGQIYLLDMGEQIKIEDLAKKMIKLSGHKVFDKDKKNNDKNSIKIKFTGLRDGEKLYEELTIGENITPTNHPKIKKVDEECYKWDKVEKIISEMVMLINKFDDKKIKEKMKIYVKEYQENI